MSTIHRSHCVECIDKYIYY